MALSKSEGSIHYLNQSGLGPKIMGCWSTESGSLLFFASYLKEIYLYMWYFIFSHMLFIIVMKTFWDISSPNKRIILWTRNNFIISISLLVYNSIKLSHPSLASPASAVSILQQMSPSTYTVSVLLIYMISDSNHAQITV